MKTKVLLNKYLVVVPDKLAISAKVLEVPVSDLRHPEGVRTSFVLLDLEAGHPILLVDNHAPFGFHMHTGLPENKNQRQTLNVSTYQEAYKFFMAEVEKHVQKFKN